VQKTTALSRAPRASTRATTPTSLGSFSVTEDLLGQGRPFPAEGQWDIGAYECQSAKVLNNAYVSTDGSDTEGIGARSRPFATMNHALAAVATSGTVKVAAGTYNEDLYLNRPVTIGRQLHRHDGDPRRQWRGLVDLRHAHRR